MEISEAVSTLSALAHESRLAVFRLLAQVSPEGVPAGEIAKRLDVVPPTLSFHLSHLSRAGLIESRREGRSILYSLRVEGFRDLLKFVTQDCCQGRPELCTPGSEALQDCGAYSS